MKIHCAEDYADKASMAMTKPGWQAMIQRILDNQVEILAILLDVSARLTTLEQRLAWLPRVGAPVARLAKSNSTHISPSPY
jgi:hypothetical protein